MVVRFGEPWGSSHYSTDIMKQRLGHIVVIAGKYEIPNNLGKLPLKLDDIVYPNVCMSFLNFITFCYTFEVFVELFQQNR